MKRILIFFALIFFALSNNVAYSLEVTRENSQEKQYSREEQFNRDEALIEQKKVSLEVENANAELEELRFEAEGAAAEDAARALQETDLMRQELARELSALYKEAEKEAEARKKELEEEEAIALKEALDFLEQTTQELDKDLQRIKLRPPRP